MVEGTEPDRKKPAAILVAVGVIGTAANWWYLLNRDRYMTNVAVLAPLGFVVGASIFALPWAWKKAAPGTGARTAVQVAAIVVGFGLGLLNLWLMKRA